MFINIIVLVSCPKCAKIYHITASELPAPVKNKKKTRGWFLSCQYCFYEWWFTAPHGFTWYEGGEPPSYQGSTIVRKPIRYMDQTNINALKATMTAEEEKDEYHEKLMSKSYSPFLDKASQTPLPTFSSVEEKVKTSFFYKAMMSFLIAVILAAAAYFFNILRKADNNYFSLNIPRNQKSSMQIHVANLNYSIHKENDHQVVHVVWDVLNQLPDSTIIPSMKISIFGICPDNAIKTSLLTDQTQCLLKTWKQENASNKQIHSQESVHFESVSNIPLDSAVMNVVVDFE